ncbi:MAG: DUF1963 domain-containing protein [Paracoccaceae bacterium]
MPVAPDDHDGASQFGGLPFLPEHLDWPRTGDGQPMHFLATVDLAKLPDIASVNGFPKSGYLHFFLHIWGRIELPRHAVLYATELGEKRSAPSELAPIDEHVRSYCETAFFDGDCIFPFTPGNVAKANTIPKTPNIFSDQEYDFSQAVFKHERAVNTPAMPRDIRLTGIEHLVPLEGPLWKPDGFGGHFPWSTSVAKHLAEEMVERIDYQWFGWANMEKNNDIISLVSALRERIDGYHLDERLQKIAGLKSRIQNAADHLVSLDTLRKLLGTEGEHQPLSSEMQAAFDAAFLSMIPRDEEDEVDRVSLRMRIRLILESLCLEIRKGGPLRADCPDAFYRLFRPELYSNNYSQHLVGGTSMDQDVPSSRTFTRLLQLDSEWPLGFNFGDCHSVEFGIDPEDLKGGRMDQASIRLPRA